MTFDPAWEAAHAARAWGQYPREELIRFVAKHYYGVEDRGCVLFLDIGCGAGASTWYLAREGFEVHAVDASASAIARTANRVNHRRNVVLYEGDIMRSEHCVWPGALDCIIDVCTLQHLSFADAEAVLYRASRWLKPGGRVFSVMAQHGSNVEAFHNTGYIRLAERRNIDKLFVPFTDVRVQAVWRFDENDNRWAEWIIDARKP